jgi:hypothetical protein
MLDQVSDRTAEVSTQPIKHLYMRLLEVGVHDLAVQ